MSARIPIEGQSMTATSLNRRIQMLRTAMGAAVHPWCADGNAQLPA